MVWCIISILLIIFLLLLFITDSSYLLSAAPTCPSKLKGMTCFLCGMTRAFLEIKEGQFLNAQKFNEGSVFLFSMILINSIIFIGNKLINRK
jgi:hypothetical protein